MLQCWCGQPVCEHCNSLESDQIRLCTRWHGNIWQLHSDGTATSGSFLLDSSRLQQEVKLIGKCIPNGSSTGQDPRFLIFQGAPDHEAQIPIPNLREKLSLTKAFSQ